MRALVWLKRDLRLEDNRVFEETERYKEVIPVFIFDDEILEDLKSYDERLGYLVQTIKSLNIKVYCFKGKTQEIIKMLLEVLRPDVLITQKAYTWSGEKRIQSVKALCSSMGIKFIEVLDGFLANPENIPAKKVFTSFYKEWLKHLDLRISNVKDLYIPDLKLPTVEPQDMISRLNLKNIPFRPEDCENRLNRFDFSLYEKTRDYPRLDGTSKLSPCIRFGIVSIRKIYEKGKISEAFVRELAWREFWYHIKINFPWTKDLEFQEKRRNIPWENREELIQNFMEGRTGYPIVDAGIRQLIQEKWIHNRVRMIIGSFITKDLLVDWRIGEKFFKQNLLDYDEVVNVGNWQWVASVGADPKPLRIFNPIIQSERFDPNCEYIKRYIPELSEVPCYQIHDPLKYKLPYYKPVVNHYERVKLLVSILKNPK